jgi:hypothetical protein
VVLFGTDFEDRGRAGRLMMRLLAETSQQVMTGVGRLILHRAMANMSCSSEKLGHQSLSKG